MRARAARHARCRLTQATSSTLQQVECGSMAMLLRPLLLVWGLVAICTVSFPLSIVPIARADDSPRPNLVFIMYVRPPAARWYYCYIFKLAGHDFQHPYRADHRIVSCTCRADDQGWNSGFNNPSLIHPHTDAILEEGVKLMHHFVYKFCSPTRSSLLSGRCVACSTCTGPSRACVPSAPHAFCLRTAVCACVR